MHQEPSHLKGCDLVSLHGGLNEAVSLSQLSARTVADLIDLSRVASVLTNGNCKGAGGGSFSEARTLLSHVTFSKIVKIFQVKTKNRQKVIRFHCLVFLKKHPFSAALEYTLINL